MSAVLLALAAFGCQTAFAQVANADKPAILRAVHLRFLGGDDKVPLDGIEVLLTHGYGQEQKKFGPFKTDKTGTAAVSLPVGFYSLHLSSKKAWPFLPVEALWNKQSRGPRPDLSLAVTAEDAEKWLGGKRRDEGHEKPATAGGAPRITYTLLPACELVLRAVDAETGKGLPGVKFYTENAVGEEWAHDIEFENLGTRQSDVSNEKTDGDGNFRRLASANAGFKYGVEVVPPGYEQVDGREVEIDVTYGQRRAEHVFKFRRLR